MPTRSPVCMRAWICGKIIELNVRSQHEVAEAAGISALPGAAIRAVVAAFLRPDQFRAAAFGAASGYRPRRQSHSETHVHHRRYHADDAVHHAGRYATA